MSGPAPTNGSRPAVAAGRLVSLPELAAALRRRRRVWLIGAALGAAAALAFSVLAPPLPTATTTLYLQHPSSSEKARVMLTEARLVESRAVAQSAIDRLKLDVAPRKLVKQYSAEILSDDLLEIRASGPTEQEAVRRVDAVAGSFLKFRRDEVERQTGVALENLDQRQVELTKELRATNDGITALATSKGGTELSDLLVRRDTVGRALDSVRQRIDSTTFDTDAIVQKSRVVDPAGPDEPSLLALLAVNLLAGTIFGLLLTVGWIVLVQATSDRTWRREDVAAAVGAPIAAGLRPLRGPLWLQRRRFQQQLADPDPDVMRTADHLLAVVAQADIGKPAVVLVSLESDGAAALALAATAVRLVELERSVLLVDLTHSNVLGRLTDVQPEEPDRLPLVGNSSALWVSFPPDQVPQMERAGGAGLFQELSAQVDVVLALATIDPAVGANHLPAVAGTAVVAATAGRSSPTGLRSVGQMIGTAGLHLHSTVFVGADAGDDSVGPPTTSARRPVPDPPRVRVSP